MAARTDDFNRILGADLALDYAEGGGYFEDADLEAALSPTAAPALRDLVIRSGVDNLEQALANRLKTRKGELAPLGHPNYGSQHHELVGEPNVDRTRNLIKLYVLRALRDEPRVRRVLKADVRPEHEPPRANVRIELTLEVEGAPPLDIVVPFSLEAAQ
jgi:phage baseplate assembly protein W